MPNQIFIDGDENQIQLRVQGDADQTLPLQTWEDSDGDVEPPLARMTADGRFELGSLDMSTQDALVEVNNDIDVDASPLAPLQGIQSRGILRRATQAISGAITWIIHELELKGDGGIADEATTLRSRIINFNTGDASGATLRAGDFEAIIKEDTGGLPTGVAVGLRSAVTNEPTANLNEAIGIELDIVNASSTSGSAVMDKATGLRSSVTNYPNAQLDEVTGVEVAITNNGAMESAYGLRIHDMPPSATETYAIHTSDGPVHLGDYLELLTPETISGQPATNNVWIYPKSDGKLYAKDWTNKEYDLSWAKHNPSATDDPTASDDSQDGYSAGSLWLNLSTDKAFICLDSTVDAAVWLEITGNGTSDHGMLTGLADDDHPQYLLVNGTRVLTGTLDVGANGLTNTNHLELNEIVAPSTPGTGKLVVYAKSDGKLYAKNSAGNEFELTDEGPSSLADLSDISSASQQPNQVLATPDGTSGAYQGRVLVAADIPNLDASKIISGTLDTARVPSLDASKVISGMLDNARINWAAPSAIGSSTPPVGTFNSLSVQPASGGASLTVNAAAETWRGIYLKTAGTNRWTLRANGMPESGGNAGSNLDVHRFDDSGSGTLALRIFRDSGNVNLYSGLAVTGNTSIGGNLNVTGSITKGSCLFRIDHPLAPTEKILYHGLVEAPRFDLIYRGTTMLTKGQATVNIDEAGRMSPGTWEVLCQNPQLWLQNDTGFAPVRGIVSPDGNITIECQDSTSTDMVSWLVVTERKDPFIRTLEMVDESGRLLSEQNKTAEGEDGEKFGSLIHQDAAERFNPNYKKPEETAE